MPGFVPEDRLIVTTVTTVAEVGPNRCNLGRSFNFCKNAKGLSSVSFRTQASALGAFRIYCTVLKSIGLRVRSVHSVIKERKAGYSAGVMSCFLI